MTNDSKVEAQWSVLSSAQTLGTSSADFASDDFAHFPLVRRSISRKSVVDDCESSTEGIGAIYKIGKTLGQGSFAVVKEGEHKATGSVVAIKIIQKQGAENLEEAEIIALSKINHPNCVALHEVYESSRKFYLVTELVTGGTVLDRVLALDRFSEKDSATAMVDVLHAIQYLHEIGLVHRDLKLENLMYASNDPSSPDYNTIKLVDFGFSKCFRDQGVMKTACGSPWNVAPEVVAPDLDKSDGYGPEVDLWAVGVILYSMLCGFPPFFSDSNAVLIRQIRTAAYKFHSPYWDEISYGAKDLISNLLVVNPARRYTAHQCLQHRWINHAVDSTSSKLSSTYRSFVLLRKLPIFDNMELACLEDVAGRLEAVQVAAGEHVVRAGEPGEAMYFISVGAVQVLVDGCPVDRLAAGSFFGEAALTAMDGHIADVVSLGATGGVRCDPQGSPLGRRRPDPTCLFRLTRADFEAVAERFPALEDRLHEVGMARVRRACSPQCSPIRALRRCNFSGRRLVATSVSPPRSPAGSPRHNPLRFSFLVREGLAAAAGAAEPCADSVAGSGGPAVSRVGSGESRRLSDVLIDDEDEVDDGAFEESWAPSCGPSPVATPGTGRRRISDLFIDDDDGNSDDGRAEATLDWGADSD